MTGQGAGRDSASRLIWGQVRRAQRNSRTSTPGTGQSAVAWCKFAVDDVELEMTQPAKVQEPSMEEILASIRRIIADDEAKPAAEKPAVEAAPAKPERPEKPAPAAPAAKAPVTAEVQPSPPRAPQPAAAKPAPPPIKPPVAAAPPPPP